AGLDVVFGAGAAASHVVHDLSLRIEPGECVALVGESGSGKSVPAPSIIGLAGDGATVTADRLSVRGNDVLSLSRGALRRVRGRDVGYVLQDALVSLDPLRPIGREIEDA